MKHLSPLDGRNKDEVAELREYFSELALIKYRVLIEVKYLVKLVEFLKTDKLLLKEKKSLLNWADNLKERDFKKLKKIEKKINHDVKAVEYLIKDKFKVLKLERLSKWVHWGLTSEDVNNLAYGLMIKDARDKVMAKKQKELVLELVDMAEKYSGVVMLGRTHGQIAVPTTLGKELVIFASRLKFWLIKMKELKFKGKLNGAVGNYNAQQLIYPKKNWIKFSQEFIKSLGLEFNLMTTQIEPGDTMADFFNSLRQFNNVCLDLSRDCWLYISFDYLKQKVVKKETGSSTMPHKVNPIDFENAEGNIKLVNSLLTLFSNELTVSRLQRDLSDSTLKRKYGLMFGYNLLAIKSLLKGLRKIEPNSEKLEKELEKHPEILTEVLQLWLKMKGEVDVYETVKNKVRSGKTDWQKLMPENWRAEKYIGLAEKLTKQEARRIRKSICHSE